MDINEKNAFDLLQRADVFYWGLDDKMELELGDDPKEWQTLNMNDVFGWALAFSEYVPDDQLVEVARLFKFYGFCGLVWWVSKRNNNLRSDFPAYNRQIDFVEAEEQLRLKAKSTTEWAYRKELYVVGK